MVMWINTALNNTLIQLTVTTGQRFYVHVQVIC